MNINKGFLILIIIFFLSGCGLQHGSGYSNILGQSRCGTYHIIENEVYLRQFKLDNLDADTCEHLHGDFIKDKNGIYYVHYEPRFGHHGCFGILNLTNVSILDGFHSPKDLTLIEEVQYAAIFKDGYKVYILDYLSPNFDIITGADQNFSSIKYISDIWVHNLTGSTSSYFRGFLDANLLEEIESKYDSKQFNITVKYAHSKYYKDNRHIYYRLHPLNNSDYDSFIALGQRVAYDKNFIFVNGKIIGTKNGSIEVICFDGGLIDIIKDQSFVYSVWGRDKAVISHLDAKSFQRVDGDSFCAHYKDKNGVYNRYFELIEGADPQSFELLNKFYTKDKNFVYYYDDIIPNADPLTFKFDGSSGSRDYDAEDKNYYYERGKVVKEK